MTDKTVTVIGGGLAGCEAAFQLAARSVPVTLLEMRPRVPSPAHHTGALAELVCSNSFKSKEPSTAPGMLKTELEVLGSLVLACARHAAVPAGSALAVDRVRFSAAIEAALTSLPTLTLTREEVSAFPDGPVIVATGPLTSPALEPALSGLVGAERLAFFDAAAPIVDADSIDRSVCFAASRYGKGDGADYLNCPMDREEYEAFVDALLEAERVTRKEFETDELFQACQPVEEVARRGRDAPRFGALKPVGLVDPRTGRRPWAVVQLRPEDRAGAAYNLVGFQTNLTFAQQRRVFRMIPGLREAEFLRYGVMHRNTFLDAPRLLTADLALRDDPRVRFAGQITGTEGYAEAAAGGLVAALGAYAALQGTVAPVLPSATAYGALLAHATDPDTGIYQPMHVNFGILPPIEPHVRDKRARHEALAVRGADAIAAFVRARSDLRFDLARDALAAALP
ncbi:MAG: methylenetetrahydrofolate--tRNA-(uracil(54)-C(5))-methyltransferase (FADH(2)-oxidizing) TrmFO [Coriobacteriia bacterium]|nr:methylenetetrahydrofolate--tRNA-(uracil(54)-C(5))-methyltransferase (FADH(2)-oxidizing) TrmFO [Coriobacteriia bacterium]